jgi:hypothetical protein
MFGCHVVLLVLVAPGEQYMKSSTERFLLFWQLCREYPKFVWMEGQMIKKKKGKLVPLTSHSGSFLTTTMRSWIPLNSEYVYFLTYSLWNV